MPLPLASPSSVAMAIWAKKPEAEREVFSAAEMRTCHQLLQGNDADLGASALSVSTKAAEPKCFLTSRMNSATAIFKVELTHSLGGCLVAPGQPNDLHGHALAFVGERIGDQLVDQRSSRTSRGERPTPNSRSAQGSSVGT